MPLSAAEWSAAESLIRLALEEDLGSLTDLTSQCLIPPDLSGEAVFVVRQAGVLAGLPVAGLVFAHIDPTVRFKELASDGQSLEANTPIASVRGSMRSILAGERTALNFLQRLCGVATQTARHVKELEGLACQLLDTRKTTPGWRLLEKYAVRQGGGHNHRLGLHDGVLIKDNHLAALGGGLDAITRAIQRARQTYGQRFAIEVEVDTLEQLEVALSSSPDIVLLDNMDAEQLRRAVELRNRLAPSVRLEASGGITLRNLRQLAETGVDRISLGALTHSALALDIGLDYLS